jgi:hypothetical protein
MVVMWRPPDIMVCLLNIQNASDKEALTTFKTVTII